MEIGSGRESPWIKLVELVEALQGTGMIHVGESEPSPARYAISYWQGTTGQIMGVGHLSADIDVMQAAERGEPAWLVLSDGRTLEVSVTRRGAGTDWGEIEIRNSKSARRPAGAAIVSLSHERQRRGGRG